MAAFNAAVQFGADAIELDAKMSADGVIVVHHDSTLDRTTSGSGRVSSRTLRELAELDAGEKFGAQFAGERIPTLKEVLVTVGEELLVNVELTNYAHPFDSLPNKAVSLVRELGLERRVIFSSFSPIALARAKRLAPDIPCGLLLLAEEPGWVRSLLRKITPHEALHPQDRILGAEMVAKEHAQGRMVNVWTVNDARRMRELVEMGVDGLITDVPDRAREVLETRSG
jgi:glycerophosphoryl diester phosphodiesterase